jgi:ectoine hydroxylase-related dioxygenase (phytanoyl-CoA dioxygenase family)
MNSKNIFYEKNYNTPWIESPFFYQILKKKNISNFLKKLAINFHEEGYVIVNLKLPDKFINKILSDVDSKLNKGQVKKNPSIYHYNESPRIVEAWKFSSEIANLAYNKKLINLLKFFYEKKPLPISTINFIKGTEQPMHSDYMHFASTPEKFLAGAWIALEKTNRFNGPLSVVPKSHKLPITDFNMLNCKKPESISSLEKNYRIYENFVKKIIIANKLKVKQIHIPKGFAIIWAANLLHGGTKMLNRKLTRKSQVIHYHFSGCKRYYNPGFSVPDDGNYALRKLEVVKN